MGWWGARSCAGVHQVAAVVPAVTVAEGWATVGGVVEERRTSREGGVGGGGVCDGIGGGVPRPSEGRGTCRENGWAQRGNKTATDFMVDARPLTYMPSFSLLGLPLIY